MKARLLHLFLVWLTVYCGVTGSLILLQAFAHGLPVAVQTLLLTMILVPLILLAIGPMAARLSARIFPPPE